MIEPIEKKETDGSNGSFNEELTYALIHDLRDPLSTVSAFTQFLTDRNKLDSKSNQIAGFIIDAAARMSTLLDDLLLLATTGQTQTARAVNLRDADAAAVHNLARATSPLNRADNSE
jgi:light-regulated signal transduction histidine kinase (bacteriophytochrome)